MWVTVYLFAIGQEPTMRNVPDQFRDVMHITLSGAGWNFTLPAGCEE
jgi:hypothetical protein